MQMAHKPIKEENTSSIKMIIYGYKYICDIENVGFGLCNRLEPLGQQAVILSINLTTQMHVPMS